MTGTIRIQVNSTNDAFTTAQAQAVVNAINTLVDTAAATGATPLNTALAAGGYTLGVVYFAPGADSPSGIGDANKVQA